MGVRFARGLTNDVVRHVFFVISNLRILISKQRLRLHTSPLMASYMVNYRIIDIALIFLFQFCDRC
jgi:hypothetical protein